MGAMEITAQNFDGEVIASDKPVLVDFWADWYGPCRAISPIIGALAEDLGDAAKVCKVNIDAERDLQARYGIMTIPTLMVFKGGEIVEQFSGLTSKSDLEELVRKHI